MLLAAAAAPPAPLDAQLKRDIQCFTLYAIAVENQTDPKVKQGASLGVMYFFTKLRLEAPNLDLPAAVEREANRIGEDPQLKAIGESCDVEFEAVGKSLLDLGLQMQGKPATTT